MNTNDNPEDVTNIETEEMTNDLNEVTVDQEPMSVLVQKLTQIEADIKTAKVESE